MGRCGVGLGLKRLAGVEEQSAHVIEAERGLMPGDEHVRNLVAVNDNALHPGQREQVLRAAQTESGPRTAIVGGRQHQTYGPTDIVRWLEGVQIAQLPWREFTISA